MKSLSLNPQQLFHKLLLKDFPDAFWKLNWLYRSGFACLLTPVCWWFQRNLRDESWLLMLMNVPYLFTYPHGQSFHIVTWPNSGVGRKDESLDSKSLGCFSYLYTSLSKNTARLQPKQTLGILHFIFQPPGRGKSHCKRATLVIKRLFPE